jgi:hypothetical protein
MAPITSETVAREVAPFTFALSAIPLRKKKIKLR